MQLARYLKREKRAARDLADWCGVSTSIAYRWIAGTSIPSGAHLRRIAKMTKGEVTPNDFYQIKSFRKEPA